MKPYEMNELRRILMSLLNSTDVVFHQDGVATTVWGRQSPYVSHKTVSFKESEMALDRDTVVFEGNYRLVVSTHPVEWPFEDTLYRAQAVVEEYYGELVTEMVPVHMVDGLLDEARRWKAISDEGYYSLKERRLIYVSFVVKKLAGFLFDGKPNYNGPSVEKEIVRLKELLTQYTDVQVGHWYFERAFDETPNEHRWMWEDFPLVFDLSPEGTVKFGELAGAEGLEEALKDYRFRTVIEGAFNEVPFEDYLEMIDTLTDEELLGEGNALAQLRSQSVSFPTGEEIPLEEDVEADEMEPIPMEDEEE